MCPPPHHPTFPFRLHPHPTAEDYRLPHLPFLRYVTCLTWFRYVYVFSPGVLPCAAGWIPKRHTILGRTRVCCGQPHLPPGTCGLLPFCTPLYSIPWVLRLCHSRWFHMPHTPHWEVPTPHPPFTPTTFWTGRQTDLRYAACLRGQHLRSTRPAMGPVVPCWS